MEKSIDKCVDDALTKLTPSDYNTEVLEAECEVHTWPQTWNDMSCGSGGLCAQSITTVNTVVVIGPQKDACVYHNSDFAFQVDNPNGEFWDALDAREMPGRIDHGFNA